MSKTISNMEPNKDNIRLEASNSSNNQNSEFISPNSIKPDNIQISNNGGFNNKNTEFNSFISPIIPIPINPNNSSNNCEISKNLIKIDPNYVLNLEELISMNQYGITTCHSSNSLLCTICMNILLNPYKCTKSVSNNNNCGSFGLCNKSICMNCYDELPNKEICPLCKENTLFINYNQYFKEIQATKPQVNKESVTNPLSSNQIISLQNEANTNTIKEYKESLSSRHNSSSSLPNLNSNNISTNNSSTNTMTLNNNSNNSSVNNDFNNQNSTNNIPFNINNTPFSTSINNKLISNKINKSSDISIMTNSNTNATLLTTTTTSLNNNIINNTNSNLQKLLMLCPKGCKKVLKYEEYINHAIICKMYIKGYSNCNIIGSINNILFDKLQWKSEKINSKNQVIWARDKFILIKDLLIKEKDSKINSLYTEINDLYNKIKNLYSENNNLNTLFWQKEKETLTVNKDNIDLQKEINKLNNDLNNLNYLSWKENSEKENNDQILNYKERIKHDIWIKDNEIEDLKIENEKLNKIIYDKENAIEDNLKSIKANNQVFYSKKDSFLKQIRELENKEINLKIELKEKDNTILNLLNYYTEVDNASTSSPRSENNNNKNSCNNKNSYTTNTTNSYNNYNNYNCSIGSFEQPLEKNVDLIGNKRDRNRNRNRKDSLKNLITNENKNTRSRSSKRSRRRISSNKSS